MATDTRPNEAREPFCGHDQRRCCGAAQSSNTTGASKELALNLQVQCHKLEMGRTMLRLCRSQMLFGDFAAGVEDDPWQVIPTRWVELAQERWQELPPQGIPMCAMGVDMTGGGRDPMVIVPRYDYWFARPVVIPGDEFDMETLGSQATGHIVGLRRDRALIILDVGGGYGQSTLEQLKENDIEVYAYKGGEKTVERTKDSSIPFRNRRSAAIWRLREALDPSQPGGSNIALPNDQPAMVADLCAPGYRIRNNVVEVESKEDVCERLGRSTDEGDAIVMAWYQGIRESTHALDLIEHQQRHNKRGMAPKVLLSRRPMTGRS